MKEILLVLMMTAQTPPPAGNAGNGQKLFMKENCYYCHGTDGQGGRDGARIAQTGLNLQGVIRYVRGGFEKGDVDGEVKKMKEQLAKLVK